MTDENNLPPRPSEQHILVEVLNDDGSCTKEWKLPEELANSSPDQGELGDLLPRMRWVWRHLHPYLMRSLPTFEDWERKLTREMDPETELATWVRMAFAFLESRQQHPSAPEDVVFETLEMMGMGIEAEERWEDDAGSQRLRITLEKLLTDPLPSELDDAGNFTEDGYLKAGPEHWR